MGTEFPIAVFLSLAVRGQLLLCNRGALRGSHGEDMLCDVSTSQSISSTEGANVLPERSNEEAERCDGRVTWMVEGSLRVSSGRRCGGL